jgi:hypothetical protein
MSNDIIERVDEEEVNLKLHVDLCAQRYHQIVTSLGKIDHRFDRVELLIEEIKSNLKKDTTDNYLKWAGAIIGVLSTTLIGLVIKLLIH